PGHAGRRGRPLEADPVRPPHGLRGLFGVWACRRPRGRTPPDPVTAAATSPPVPLPPAHSCRYLCRIVRVRRGLGMDVDVAESHQEFRRQIREFAEAEIAPVTRELDETSTFPGENIRKMADLGLFGVNVPKEYGGLGLDYLSYILVIEELARV